MIVLLNRWQHETTSNKCSSSVIILVISTCVLLLGSHLTQHTTGAIDGTHSRSLPGARGRPSLARLNSTAHEVMLVAHTRQHFSNNSSAHRHYPTYYDLIKLPGERQHQQVERAGVDIIAPHQPDQLTKSAQRNHTRKLHEQESETADKLNSQRFQLKHRISRRAHQLAKSEDATARGKNETNFLDEEIETMEALIEVLDAANKKLVEQKRRQKFKRGEEDSAKSAARADFSVTRASTGGSGTNSSTPSTAVTNVGKRARYDSATASRLEQPRAAPSEQVKSETTRDGVARPAPSSHSDALNTEDGEREKKKKRKFKRKKSTGDRRAPYNATQILDRPAWSTPAKLIVKEPPPPSLEPPAMKFPNERRQSASDSDQVRPGFDNTPMSQNYVGQYQAHPMGVTLDPLGGIMPAVPPEQMQQLHGPHLLLQGHRPIVAHDLLNTRQPPSSQQHHHQEPSLYELHQPNQQQQQDNNIEDERVTHAGDPEVLVLNQRQQQLPGGDQREPTGGPMYESQPQAPTSAIYPPLQALQMLKRQQLLGYGPYQIQQDPYGYSTTTTTERPHDKPLVLDGDNQLGVGSKPIDWSPDYGKPHRGEQVDGELPVLMGHAPQTALNGATQGLHAERAAMQPQTNRQLNNRFGDTNGNAGVGVNQLNGLGAPNPAALAALNPLQHLLDAAKNQQDAALAYERGRLNYELELRKREEAMRRQHEANLERQRLSANQRAAAAAQQQQQERQQQPQDQQQSTDQAAPGEQNGQGEAGEGNTDQQQQHEQEQQAQQNGDNGNEQQAQRDGNANQQEQEQPNDDSANNQQQQQQDDPDMKNFQNFAGDTDFTDLFPKGVLSDAEIKEMREQQAEQKQRQEQEEQEERDKQRAEAEAEEEEQQQQPQEQPASGTGNDGGGGEQQPEQQPVESGAQNSEQNAAQDAQQQSQKNTTTVSEVVTQPQQVLSQPLATSLGAANTSSTGQSSQTAAISGLPSYMFKNVSAVNLTLNANNQTGGAQKSRRSSLPQPLAQPLQVPDSEYNDRHMKPFLSSLLAINKIQLAGQDGWRAAHPNAPLPSLPEESSELSHRKRRHEPASSSAKLSDSANNQLVSLVDFDDLLENYSDSLRA